MAIGQGHDKATSQYGGRSLGTVSRSRYLGEKTGRSRHFCPEIALGDTLLDPAVIESKEQKLQFSRNLQDVERNTEPDLVGPRGRILTNLWKATTLTENSG